MKRAHTCIICPNGCEIESEYDGDQVLSITGSLCPKGNTYVMQELVNPQRTIATSVRVEDGALSLTSVRLTNSIPKDRIWDVMQVINKQSLAAPVHIGDVMISNILGLDSDVIVTKNVEKSEV